ncbi:MAG: glycoside hydrolase family 88 protein [Paludibacter sp.]|nr:glycoside hydrolase family 88 protein [Paludibacter sp.]
MKKSFLYVLMIIGVSLKAQLPGEFKSFPGGSDPGFIGSKLTQRYLSSTQSTTPVKYPEVCTWFGALRFANVTRDGEMLQQLENRFIPILGENSGAMQTPNHVDNTVFGIIPLQLYLQTDKQAYYNIGVDFADRQWTLPSNPSPSNAEKYNALAAAGLSWQTRFWIDDMFMITAIQSQAYLATKDPKYIQRAAHEMTVYLDSLQRPNGLFYHNPIAPFFWSRGNGWMAVGMADLLTYLPENNPDRPKILQAYQKMMATLKSYRNDKGLWRQLIDQEDAWTETSGSAMFTYAMIMGVKNGWLDVEEYAPVVRKAWLALVTYLNDDWALTEVCIGTNVGYTKEYYMSRNRPVGDLHGQAALLWCALALYDAETNTNPTLKSLSYDYGSLSPAFDPAITSYTCSVPAGINQLIPNLIPSYRATISSGAEVVNLDTGSGTSVINVNAPDGVTSITYTVNFVTGSDENLTHLIVNNDFDLAPDADCQPVQVGPGINGWDTSGIPCWRLSKSSCAAKQFYGWTHNQSLLGSSTSQGINGDAPNKHGNWTAWIGGNRSAYTEFEFSQTIDKSQLTAGTYKVQCLLAVGKNDRRNNQRLFANNVVQYFGNPYKYEKNLVAGEQYSFAGHVEFSDVVLREMTVYVTLLEGDSLKIGIRTSNMESDGDVSTQKSPMFRIDYFRLTKMASANDVPVTNNTRVNYVVNNRSLTVMGVDSYTLYNVNGVKTADVNNTSETIPELLPGVYIIKTKNAGVLKAIIN